MKSDVFKDYFLVGGTSLAMQYSARPRGFVSSPREEPLLYLPY